MNAEYICMNDVIADVPGGFNNHNYANTPPVWSWYGAGWGHTSKKPSLPNSPRTSLPLIRFIGLAGPPRYALGDKIGSTIIAQNAGVSCIKWNGGHVRVEYNCATGTLPDEDFWEVCVKNATEASMCAAAIVFPVMTKASEGGRGGHILPGVW